MSTALEIEDISKNAIHNFERLLEILNMSFVPPTRINIYSSGLAIIQSGVKSPGIYYSSTARIIRYFNNNGWEEGVTVEEAVRTILAISSKLPSLLHQIWKNLDKEKMRITDKLTHVQDRMKEYFGEALIVESLKKNSSDLEDLNVLSEMRN